MIAAAMALTVLAFLCALGALAILWVPRWWDEYRSFACLLLGLAVVLLVIAGWGLTLPDEEVLGGLPQVR